jgi:oxygen-independent coproporphyrinogen-3 oxidase
VYVHVPFCRHRCGYCNFTLVAGRDDLFTDYLRALQLELSQFPSPSHVRTVFLGGGTPTHLDNARLARLLEMVRQWCGSAEPYEFSIEANPADLNVSTAAVLAEFGVNRVSLGAQSFDAAKLECLERDHSKAEIESACALAREIGAQVSLDLIFAVPGESAGTWQADLTQAIQLAPDHVSTYGLTFERGARFWSRLQKGELQRHSDEHELAMYETAIATLTAADFEHYEVSNFSRPDRRCRHNEVYWTGATYYGFGPGAASHRDGIRKVNHRSTTTYLRRMLEGETPVAEQEELDPAASARERLVFGLRRLEGVEAASFASETGFDVRELAGRELERLAEAGLIAWNRKRVRLTHQGLLLADTVCSVIIGQ